MSANIATIESAILSAVLASGSNTRVIFFHPNAPRPKLPYTSIQLLNIGPEVNDWGDFDTVGETHKYYGYRELEFSISFYGDNAKQESIDFQGSIRKQEVRDALRLDANISVLSTTSPTNTTVLIGGEYEKRFTIDILINAPIEDGSTSESTGYFDTTSISWDNKPT